MWNAYANGAAHQKPEYGAIQKKHPDEVAEKGYVDCVQVLGGDVQPNRGGRGGTHRGGRGVQIPRAAVGPVGRRLSRIPT